MSFEGSAAPPTRDLTAPPLQSSSPSSLETLRKDSPNCVVGDPRGGGEESECDSVKASCNSAKFALATSLAALK